MRVCRTSECYDQEVACGPKLRPKHSCFCGWQVSSRQLQSGAVHLRERLTREKRFYAELAQLQRQWNVQVAQWRK